MPRGLDLTFGFCSLRPAKCRRGQATAAPEKKPSKAIKGKVIAKSAKVDKAVNKSTKAVAAAKQSECHHVLAGMTSWWRHPLTAASIYHHF